MFFFYLRRISTKLCLVQYVVVVAHRPFVIEIPVSFSDISADQSNQDDSTKQLAIVLALSGVALITLVVAIATVVVVMRSRSASKGDHAKILAPGTPTRTHAWLDVSAMRTEKKKRVP